MNGIRQFSFGRLADEQVNVLRHYCLSIDAQGELTARVLQTLNEEVEQLGSREVWLAAITTEGYEVGLAGFLEAVQTAGHAANLHYVVVQGKGRRLAPTERARTWGTRPPSAREFRRQRAPFGGLGR